MTSLRNFTLFIIVVLLFSFSNKEPDYSKTLPGVVKITNYLYYDKTEATNKDWLEYSDWMKSNYGETSSEYIESFPDTLVWQNSLTYNQPYVRYYLTHPAYQDYPVVGVSWQQATDYCAWRTQRVLEALKAKDKLDKAPKFFTYRLPTNKEWSMMYEDVSKQSFIIGEEGKKAYVGMARFNMKRSSNDTLDQDGVINDNADVTAPVESYWPNQYGVYNIKGNVSEWLYEENGYVGGAWNTNSTDDVSAVQHSQESSASIGFRCVCEVLEEDAP